MDRRLISAVCGALAALLAAQATADVRDEIVQQSRKAYFETVGPCPCPEDTMANGDPCAHHSAYVKRCGAEPFCYPKDVTPEDIETFRRGETPSRIGRRPFKCQSAGGKR